MGEVYACEGAQEGVLGDVVPAREAQHDALQHLVADAHAGRRQRRAQPVGAGAAPPHAAAAPRRPAGARAERVRPVRGQLAQRGHLAGGQAPRQRAVAQHDQRARRPAPHAEPRRQRASLYPPLLRVQPRALLPDDDIGITSYKYRNGVYGVLLDMLTVF